MPQCCRDQSIIEPSDDEVIGAQPNAGVKPRRTRRMGASIARMPVSFNEATKRRRLERLVRREGSRGG